MKSEDKAKGVNHPDYNKVHQWLRAKYGNANCCEFCNDTSSKRFEWALLKDKDYEKERSNFIMLCCSCHRKYDVTDETRKKMSKLKKGRPAHNKGKDSRINKICSYCGKRYKHYKKSSRSCSKKCEVR